MGLNTTVVVLNDAVPHIERDPEFGARLARAIQEFDGTPKTVSAGHHGNAAMIVEMHEALDRASSAAFRPCWPRNLPD